jgi:phage I-like protein
MTRGPESCVRLSVVLAGDEPPSEFRIFTAGKVETSKGTFLFDAKSAESVMAAYREHGTELMVDYDHASLGSTADPALAGRAAGWFAPRSAQASSGR